MFGLPHALPRARPHLANARDVGAAASGLATGVCLRSDAPRHGDEPPGDLAWPPRTVLDLRDDAELKNDHPLAEVADVLRVPILEEASVQGLMAGGEITLRDLYLGMVAGPQAEGFAEVVRAVATAPAPVLVHCSAGKDRSGIATALVLALVGASREAIVADYVATRANMEAVMARVVKDLPIRKRLLAQASLGGLAGEPGEVAGEPGAVAGEPVVEAVEQAVEQAVDQVAAEAVGTSVATGVQDPGGDRAGLVGGLMARVTAMLDAPPEAIAAVLDTWDAHPGGVEGWYLANGGDRDTLSALRQRLLAG